MGSRKHNRGTRESKRSYKRRVMTGLFTLMLLFANFAAVTHEAFASESDYVYRPAAGGVEITKYTGRAGVIAIPETLGGQPVVRIGEVAFFNKQLTSVVIPDSVIGIGSGAFDTNELTSVIIPRNVATIESYAFSSNRLAYIEIGSQVSSIAGSAFTANPLSEIRVDAGNPTYQDIDGKGVYTKDGKTLVTGTASGEIASGTVEIGDHAFRGRGATSTHIPDQVTRIGEYAFLNNELARVAIPDSVTIIGHYAFENNKLTELEIGENVEQVGLGAFRNNQLTRLEIPDRVTTLSNFAFTNNQLSHVKVGAGVNGLSGIVFSENPLASIELAAGNASYELDPSGQGLYSSDGETLVIGTVSGEIRDGTTTVGSRAFSGRGLAGIAIPASVSIIADNAFHNNQLTNVTFSPNVKEIARSAFANNAMTNLVIPDGVEKVGDSAFTNNQIGSVIIGKDVSDLYGSTFTPNPLTEIRVDEDNSSYKDINGEGVYTKNGTELVVGTTSGKIEEGTAAIANSAFYGMGVENVTIPGSITNIGSLSFYDNNIKRIEIPSAVTSIGFNAFSKNEDLVIVGVKGSEAEAYALDARIPFLSEDDRIAVRFEPGGSSWQVQAMPKVTVYSLDELETDQFYIWTASPTPPAFDESWTMFTSGQQLSKTDDGEWYLHIYASDGNGNDGLFSSGLFQVMDAAPVIHLSATVGDHGQPYNEGEWVNQKVNIAIQAEDVNMQELRIQMKHDGTEDEFIVGPGEGSVFERTLTEGGIYELGVTARDEGGHTATAAYTIKISLDSLRLDAELKAADGSDYASGDWTRQSVTASIYAWNMQGLTVTSVVYSLNEGAVWTPYLAPLTFDEEGSHPLWVKAEDELSNEQMHQLQIRIDRTAPVIRFEPDGSAIASRNVSSEIHVDDADSGPDEDALRYIWSTSSDPLDEHASWQAFQQGETLRYSGQGGNWYLHIHARDWAENERYQVSQPFLVQAAYVSDGDSSGGYDSGRSNANASGLHLSVGQLSPEFSADVTDYEAQVDHDVEQITLTVKTAQRGDAVAINGERLSDEQEEVHLPLAIGTNQIEIVITAQDGMKKTYTLTIERASLQPDEPVIPQQSFTDTAGHWAERMIQNAMQAGWISGYPDDTFRPDHSITRAEFTVMLIGALQPDEAGTALAFTDAADIGAWARQAVAQAVRSGIISGYEDGSFRPNTPITRARAAVIMARAAGIPLDANTATGFMDDGDIPHWAKGAVEASRQFGIVSGRDGGRFAPNDTATRAEAVAMLLRMLEAR